MRIGHAFLLFLLLPCVALRQSSTRQDRFTTDRQSKVRLRLPKEERTWHGALGGFVPYDFRMPTVEKIKTTFWNPDGAIVVNRVFGVGWTINLGAIVAKVRSLSKTD